MKRVQEMLGVHHLRSNQLCASKRQFHGRSPLQLVATEAGARLVAGLLHRIDEGMAA